MKINDYINGMAREIEKFFKSRFNEEIQYGL